MPSPLFHQVYHSPLGTVITGGSRITVLPCLINSVACIKNESILRMTGRRNTLAATSSVAPSLCNDR